MVLSTLYTHYMIWFCITVVVWMRLFLYMYSNSDDAYRFKLISICCTIFADYIWYMIIEMFLLQLMSHFSSPFIDIWSTVLINNCTFLIDTNHSSYLSLFTEGYLDFRDHESMATMIRWPTNVGACRVSILIFGIFLSAGTNICLVDYKSKNNTNLVFSHWYLVTYIFWMRGNQH